jgi:hypothetical protein
MNVNRYLQLLPLLFPFCSAQAREFYGVDVSDSLDIEGQKLALHGAGLRSKFMVKVYVGGLYLPDTKVAPASILESQSVKAVKLHFKRDVSSDKMRAAWSEGFANNCSKNCDAYKKDLEKVNAVMTDVKEKETMTFYFSPDKLSFYKNDVKKLDIPSQGLSREILAIFLGSKPADADLKKGMLSK